MRAKAPDLDKAFIERQFEKLVKLHDGLLSTTRAGEGEETVVQNQSAGEAREYEDDAQKLALLEIDGILVCRNTQRLRRVEAALKKIENGTYGFSDTTGKPIPRDRLDAVPEAISTFAEEEAHDWLR